MKRRELVLRAVVLVLALVVTSRTTSAAQDRTAADTGADAVRRDAEKRLDTVAVPFVANTGQLDAKVAYYAPTFGGTVFITHDGRIVFGLAATGMRITEHLVGGTARPQATISAPTEVSILHGSDPARWRTGIPTYRAVSLGEVYPGIDLTLRAYGKQVEHVFTVAPGAASDAIRVRPAGGKKLSVGADGALTMRTRGQRRVRLTRPTAYQMIHGQRRPVDVAYEVFDDRYGFRVGSYDPDAVLVIDPVLQATYLGGSGGDHAAAIAIDPATGKVYVAGDTTSSDFPHVLGGMQQTPGGGRDAFVARLDANLTTLEQATYIGGSSFDQATAMTLAGGTLYVAGLTFSADFPGTAGGAQAAYGGNEDAFVARFDPNLALLQQATYFGGGSSEYSTTAIAVSQTTGEVYVAGTTSSVNLPGSAGGAQSAHNGPSGGDAFVARFSGDLTVLGQATYLGGSGGVEGASSVAVHPTTGEVYVAGITDAAADFPGTAGGAQQIHGGGYADAFVARLNPALTALEQATYLGGGFFAPDPFSTSGGEGARSVVLDVATGEVYVAGWTNSSDFPGTAGGAQPLRNGFNTGFVARLNSTLTALDQATYVGGIDVSVPNGASALVLDPSTSSIYVGGVTSAYDFPGTAGGAQAFFGGGQIDAFVARLDVTLTALLQATYLGGEDFDAFPAMARRQATGEIYVANWTRSVIFPGGTIGAAQPTYAGNDDAFVVRLSGDLTGPPSGGCGDGYVDAGEQCDDGTNNGTSISCCVTDCTVQPGGTACTSGGVAGTCRGDANVCVACGDGLVDQGEECDDGLGNGTDSCCTATCTLEPSGTACITDGGSAGTCLGGIDFCAGCGDGYADVGEQCDDDALNGSADVCCTTACTLQPGNFACSVGRCTGASDGCQVPAYVAVGDSTTTGFSVPTCHEDRTTSPFGCVGIGPATPYPTRVAIGNPGFVPVYRVGIWGYTIQDAVAAANQGYDAQGPWEPQLLAVSKATRLVTVSLGANDMEFSDVKRWAQDCIQYQAVDPNSCENAATNKAENLRFQIQAMMNRLDVAQQNGATVVVVLYYNPYNDQKDAGPFGILSRDCSLVHNMSEVIVGALDNVLRDEAQKHGFLTVDLRPAFRTHGAGSSDSFVFGSDCDLVGGLGAVDIDLGWPPIGIDDGEIKKRFDPHPNDDGTAAQANEVLKVIP